jgi:hypothetical protein
MTGPTLTQADVQERLACLKELLQDVGKDIAAALTQLVLQRKKPSREDALKFLAARLASVSVAYDYTISRKRLQPAPRGGEPKRKSGAAAAAV